MDDLRDKIVEISTDVKEIRIQVTKNTVSLDSHMQRTELNEQRILYLERWLLGMLAALLVGVIIKLLLG